jgi:hypothetical protein
MSLWSAVKGALMRPFVPTPDERWILDELEARRAEGITSMRVVGRRLTVDPKEVMKTQRFREYQRQASLIVNRKVD